MISETQGDVSIKLSLLICRSKDFVLFFHILCHSLRTYDTELTEQIENTKRIQYRTLCNVASLHPEQ